jgi:hypothetical protein
VTRLEPAAFLAVDGVDVARSTPAGVPTELLALDGLELTWGRGEALDQQEPATAHVELFDPSRLWHRSRDWIGVLVTLRWEVTVAGVPTVRTFFRGRISRINPRLQTLAGVRGTRVDLELTSIVTDLANVVPAVGWPYEDLSVRRGRLSTAAVAAGVTGGVGTRTDWDLKAASVVAHADQQSIWAHIVLLFDGLTDWLSYRAHTDAITAVGSRDYRTFRSLGRLVRDDVSAATDRAGQGVYARARAVNSGGGLYLDARELDYPDDAGLVRDQTSAITRIRLTGVKDVSTGELHTLERVMAGANEAVHGIRTLDVDSGLSLPANATTELTRWETQARAVVNAWQLEPITIRLSATGGLEELDQALYLMAAHEYNALFFLQGSELPLMGVPPLIGIMGGALRHTAGHWELELTPHPVTLAARQHAITWEEIDDGTPANRVECWDSPHPNGLHPSLTCEDLAWVGYGLGVPDTATLTDYGWDYLP